MTLAVVVLWAFPGFWYKVDGTGQVQWFSEKIDIPGWSYSTIPISESAERLLVADHTFNGVFNNSRGQGIHVFSAKRYEEKANEIGLFVHTPDRCWVEAGWKLQPIDETLKEVDLHSAKVPVERRIFEHSGRRELVYFFGLIGGRPAPYRLDHNLSIGLRSSAPGDRRRSLMHASDSHFWARLWESFASRRQLLGPKQFIRISTTVDAGEISSADDRLEKFLRQWLVPSDYQEEKSQWKMAATKRSGNDAN